MARKPHLVAMTLEHLEDYRRHLRLEQAAVLAELELRKAVNEFAPIEQLEWDFYEYPAPPNVGP